MQRDILRLYKDLLKYSKSVQLTDREYFRRRITKEFKQNKDLTDEKEVSFAIKKGVALLERARVV